MLPLNRFYVYALMIDDVIFYIGKGQSRRVDSHLREANKGHDCHKCRKIRKSIANGHQYSTRILFDQLKEDQAFLIERVLITTYKPQLVNQTNGGEGVSGLILTQETRAKMGRPCSEERRAAVSAQFYGKPLSQEHRTKIANVMRGKPKSQEHSMKVGHSKRGKSLSIEHRKKISIALSKSAAFKTAQAKTAASRRGKPLSIERRKKISDSERGKIVSDETRAKLRAAWIRRRAKEQTSKETK